MTNFPVEIVIALQVGKTTLSSLDSSINIVVWQSVQQIDMWGCIHTKAQFAAIRMKKQTYIVNDEMQSSFPIYKFALLRSSWSLQ